MPFWYILLLTGEDALIPNNIAYLLGNYSREDYIQKYNIADKLDDNIREKILNMFLGLPNCESHQ